MTPQRRAAVERAVALRAEAHRLRRGDGGGAPQARRTACGPLRSAGTPPRPPTSRWISSPRCWRARARPPLNCRSPGGARARSSLTPAARTCPGTTAGVSAVAARPGDCARARLPRRCPRTRWARLVERLLDALAVTARCPCASRRRRTSERRGPATFAQRERRRGGASWDGRGARSRGRSSSGSPRAGQARGSARLRVQHHPRRAPGDPQRHRGLPVPPAAKRALTGAACRPRRGRVGVGGAAASRRVARRGERRGSKETRRGGKRRNPRTRRTRTSTRTR